MSPLVAPDDQSLLEALASGDVGALESLYERHAPWLSVRLMRRCNDREVVADVLQDTFVAVWQGARRYQGTGEVGAWMWGIAIRRLIGVLRRQPRTTVPTHDEPQAVSAEELVLAGTEHGDLAGALRQLSPELRAVVQATILDGLTTREAAKLLGIPAGTVKTRMMRARSELRGAMT